LAIVASSRKNRGNVGVSNSSPMLPTKRTDVVNLTLFLKQVHTPREREMKSNQIQFRISTCQRSLNYHHALHGCSRHIFFRVKCTFASAIRTNSGWNPKKDKKL